jgi:hypothetical protein
MYVHPPSIPPYFVMSMVRKIPCIASPYDPAPQDAAGSWGGVGPLPSSPSTDKCELLGHPAD